MKKSLLYFFVSLVLCSCAKTEAGLENDLIGSWVHIRSGAAAGGNGSVIFKGSTYSLPQKLKDSDFNFTFKQNGVCDCPPADSYKITGGNITFTNSKTKESYEYEVSNSNGILNLFETISQLNKTSPGYTKIDYVHILEKK
jgi:hypothetical protein